MSYVHDNFLTPEEIERESDNEVTDEDFKLPTNTEINDDSESRSDSECGDEGQRCYVYNWDWKNINNTVVEIHIIGDSGVNDDISQKLCYNSVPKEIDVFSAILSDDFFKMIVLETNRYAQVKLDTVDVQKWFLTTVDKLKMLFAIIVLLSQNPKQRLEIYWTKRKILQTPIFF